MGKPQEGLAGTANECWSTDFVPDALYDGRRLRALTVVDNYMRECLAIEVNRGIDGGQVVGVLGRITMEHRKRFEEITAQSLFQRC
jgi:hypothetical protein